MASLRDVFNHIGKKVLIERGGVRIVEGLGIRRGLQALLEPRLDPIPGDILRLLDTQESFVVGTVQPMEHAGTVDHYKVELKPSLTL